MLIDDSGKARAETWRRDGGGERRTSVERDVGGLQ